MKVIQVTTPGAPFELVDRPIPTPGPKQVVLKVQSCGLCHSEKIVKDKEWPFLTYPRIPGHEAVGTIYQAGSEVPEPYNKVGTRFGVGWHGGECGTCDHCRKGNAQFCSISTFTGVTVDGGMAEYTLVRYEALVRIPDHMSSVEASPLLCAGLTVYRSLALLRLPPGSWVGVQGIGGLGSLGIQYAKKMGYKVMAVSTSSSKKDFSLQLGADAFFDTSSVPEGEIGSAIIKVADGKGLNTILATAPSSKSMSNLLPGLAYEGVLMLLAGLHEPLTVDPGLVLGKNLRIQGFTAGCARHNEECVAFSDKFGVKSMIELFKPDQINEAYEKTITGKVRFRSVIVFDENYSRGQ